MSRFHDFTFTSVRIFLTNDNHVPLGWCPGTLSTPNHNLSVTRNQRITSETLNTAANWSMIPNLAVCILSASSNAWVLAIVVETCQALGTFSVIFTISLSARHKWISLVTSWTPAGGSISCRNTVSIGSTRIWVAWIRLFLASCDGIWCRDVARDTLTHWVTQSVDIAVSVWTTWTGEAWIWWWSSSFYLAATCDSIRLRLVSWQTSAHRVTLSVLIAFSIGTTRRGVTGIRSWHTPVLITDISRATVTINLTFSSTSRNGVWHWDVSSKASAHRVSLSVFHTLSVGSTW